MTDTLDLSATPDTDPAAKAVGDLKKNLSHFLISSMPVEQGAEIVFGDTVLVFKPKVPATAMAYLISVDHDRIEALRGYIRLALTEECREDFERLLDNIPLEGLNAIVEYLAEVNTSFPTK